MDIGAEGTPEKEDFYDFDFAIDTEKAKIEITIPQKYPLTKFYLQVEVSEGAAANPANTVLAARTIDPVNGSKITVTAENGDTKLWKVYVLKDPPPAKDIVGVSLQTAAGGSIAGIEPVIDAEKGEVVISVPRGNPLDELCLQLNVSNGATASPANEDLATRYMNFKGETITVTGEDGGARVWTVSARQESSPVQELTVELLGNYQVRFLFAYPNYKEINGTSGPEYVPYDSPILLSYFGDDNDIKQGDQAGIYYNTLIVSAGGFKTWQWKIDGKAAPIREGVADNNTTNNVSTTLTIHAQDWTLEDLHTVTFIGIKTDAKGNEQKYSGEFTFKVVEKIPVTAQAAR
ncbi:MAG: hypothetical protein LBG42_05915 [Treponema sp.]|nr:hypothetical protein [Treponema sp.]